jgi:hypothetical protein
VVQTLAHSNVPSEIADASLTRGAPNDWRP